VITSHKLCARSIIPLVGLLAATLAACGGGGGGSGGGTPIVDPDPTPVPGEECEEGKSYDSTFEGIQDVIFERHGCTQDVCHGSSAIGGLDLRPEAAYRELLDEGSLGSAHPRVTPGDEERSFLWLKLAAATRPGEYDIAGAPMPNGLPPLSEDELELVRMWIYAGAPESASVPGTEDILGACLPDPKPITIRPLDPPAEGEGIQLVMPEWNLPAASEHEICFASYYDITAQVPDEMKDPTGQLFRFKTRELRQDPQSHHLILNYAQIGVDQLDDPSFGAWTCKSGEKAGETCEPTDLGFCGSGQCSSEFRDGFACIGFGPNTGGRPFFPIGGSQQSQSRNEYADGVFAQIPMRGVLFWNSHAFNLTSEDHPMRGRLNYYFASPEEQRWPIRGIFNTSMIFSANAAPYTTQLVCNDQVLPQGARLFNLSSHTHKHGKHFTVDLHDGTRIYESFVYNDPVDQNFDPPLAFDSPNVAERTLRYCSLYNNGVNEDGSPNPEKVTRASRVPFSAQQTLGRCDPTACVNEGMVGEACRGSEDDAACDSSPGAGDGDCDACRITGGESTENEMFILIGSYYLEDGAGGGDSVGSFFSAKAGGGRSDYTEIALGPSPGCTSSHASHGGHGGADAGEHTGH